MTRILKGLHCNGCGKNIFKDKGDYFMLKDKVWQKVAENDYIGWHYILCKCCTESVLGRKLTKEDYINAPVNDFLKEGEYLTVKE